MGSLGLLRWDLGPTSFSSPVLVNRTLSAPPPVLHSPARRLSRGKRKKSSLGGAGATLSSLVSVFRSFHCASFLPLAPLLDDSFSQGKKLHDLAMEMRARESINISEDLTGAITPYTTALHDAFLHSHCSSCFRKLPLQSSCIKCCVTCSSVWYCCSDCLNSDSMVHLASGECCFIVNHLKKASLPCVTEGTSDFRAAIRLLYVLEARGLVSSDSIGHSSRIGGLSASGIEEVLEEGDAIAERILEGSLLMSSARKSRAQASVGFSDGLETLTLWAVITNSVEVQVSEGQAMGIAVYGPSFSWFNHSCFPNASYRFALAPWHDDCTSHKSKFCVSPVSRGIAQNAVRKFNWHAWQYEEDSSTHDSAAAVSTMAGDDDLVALTFSQKLDRLLMLCVKLQTQITAMSRQLPPLPSMLPPVDSSSTKLQPPPKLSVIEVPTAHVCFVVEASAVKIPSAPSHMDNHHKEVDEACSVEMPSAAAPHPQAPLLSDLDHISAAIEAGHSAGCDDEKALQEVLVPTRIRKAAQRRLIHGIFVDLLRLLAVLERLGGKSAHHVKVEIYKETAACKASYRPLHFAWKIMASREHLHKKNAIPGVAHGF
ncbi:hypothetical protein PR202_ga20357 [Eleusine coracana subsp. coracana]|uniref:SET domain-containing protein n=1 Tax=Eleusine coracana subsp. coracana TaxID=191504 RepID=A0AAV5CY24_ELECO|nr:hypothetical protein PR202_ga20357 [Eleusine coracana subsp. coracana]